MKTSIFDATFVLPPLVEMTEVEKDMPTATYGRPIAPASAGICPLYCQETNMKTSIFNMNFTLPPLIEMTEVEKDMPEYDLNPYTVPAPYPYDMCGRPI